MMGSVAGEGEVVLGNRGRSDGAEQVGSRCGEEIAGLGAGWVDLAVWGGASEAHVVGGPVPDRRMSCSPVKFHGRLGCVARIAASERHRRRSW
jgi:hypothetical protein